jgi:hypothetical protein
MKRQVFVIGRELRELVPFSVAFSGPDYDVTLIETQDVMGRAMALAMQHRAWFLLVLSGDEDPAALERIEALAPATSLVIEDGDDPVIALAHLIAAESWETAVRAEMPAPPALEAEQQRG